MKADFTTGLKVCSRCRVRQPIGNYHKNKILSDGLQHLCIDCSKVYRQRPAAKAYEKTYYRRPKAKLYRAGYEKTPQRKAYKKGYNRTYSSLRREKDPLFRFRGSLRNLIRMTLRGYKNIRGSKTEKILGCLVEEFRIYIESKFYPNTETGVPMTWGNHGMGAGKWQLDHRDPVLLAQTRDEVLALNHYSNWQPLWSNDHLRKTAKDRKRKRAL